MPLHCTCGKQFSVEHALSCPHGGFPSIRHNELRDITAELLSEVCHNVGTEPPLQPITDEYLIGQLTGKMVPGLMLQRRVFGRVTDNAHFSAYGFSTLSHQVIAMPLWLKATVGTSWRRKELMTNE